MQSRCEKELISVWTHGIPVGLIPTRPAGPDAIREHRGEGTYFLSGPAQAKVGRLRWQTVGKRRIFPTQLRLRARMAMHGGLAGFHAGVYGASMGTPLLVGGAVSWAQAHGLRVRQACRDDRLPSSQSSTRGEGRQRMGVSPTSTPSPREPVARGTGAVDGIRRKQNRLSQGLARLHSTWYRLLRLVSRNGDIK